MISYHEVALNAAHHIDDMIAQANLAKMGDELLELVAEKKVAPMIERIIR